MSANSVQVSYRHVELATGATLEPAADGLSRLAIATPPPVRTVLAVTSGGETKAYAVVSVQEVATAGGSRSCLLREVANDELPVKVGTERHGAGALGPAPEAVGGVGGSGDESESIGSSLAVPAPVVNDDSEPLQLGDDNGDSNGDAGDSNGDSEASGTSDVGSAGTDATNADGGPRGKKRRGRQRR